MAIGGYNPGVGQPKKSEAHHKAMIYVCKRRATLKRMGERTARVKVMFDRFTTDCIQTKAYAQELKDALAEVNNQIAVAEAYTALANYAAEPPKMPDLPPVIVPEAPFDWTQALPEAPVCRPLDNPPKTATIPKTYIDEAYDANMTPLDFMLKVMRDPDADPQRRDRMAMAAAPFIHLKAAEAKLGKREEAKRKAAEVGAASSKFSAPAAPRLVANGR